MTEVLERIVLKNGLLIRFLDQSNRYFGDFHRICLKVLISLPEGFDLPEGLNRETACLERTLEKMGVASVDLESERKSLIDAFMATARTYMEAESFPQQLALKLQREKHRPVFLRS